MSLEPPNYAEGSLRPRLDDSDITAPSGKMTRLTKKQPKLLSRSVSHEFDANLFFHLLFTFIRVKRSREKDGI